jgi:hypothetical protein
LSVCPNLKPLPTQIQAMSTVDDTSDDSDKGSVIILVQVQTTLIDSEDPSMTNHRNKSAAILPQDEEHQPINLDLVLIDSQTTVDLFPNNHHVQNIHPEKHPICIHCNKGTLTTTEEADFGDTPVYFDSRGIANVLSLYHLGQKFWVTYNSRD